MPVKKLSVGTVIEKNKISSDNTFLILIDLEVKDEEGGVVQHVRFVKNSENIVFQGNTYQAANFTLDISVEANSEPSISLTAQDQTRTLAQFIEAYGGLVDNNVTMYVVNSAALTAPEEIRETFKITGAEVNNYIVRFQLGTPSAVNKRFPLYRQFKDRCMWRYKGPRCKYAGGMTSCDYTLNGPNGCNAHNNSINFGAFPGLNTLE